MTFEPPKTSENLTGRQRDKEDLGAVFPHLISLSLRLHVISSKARKVNSGDPGQNTPFKATLPPSDTGAAPIQKLESPNLW